jgi:ATP phosphoribosyltransferase
MFKFYLPSEQLEEPSCEILKYAGFKVTRNDSNVKLENTDIQSKLVKQEDAPLLLCLDKADLALVSSEVVREFLFSYPKASAKLALVSELPFKKTSLLLAASRERFPLVTNIPEFMTQFRKSGQIKITVATKFPATVQAFLKKKGVSQIKFFAPAGLAVNWLLPPNPEADLIAENVDDPKILNESCCNILEHIQDNQPVLIASRLALEDPVKKSRIDDFVKSLRHGMFRYKEKQARLLGQLELPSFKVTPAWSK